MKASSEKTSVTTTPSAAQAEHKPFFAKAGGGDFFSSSTRTPPFVQMKLTVNKVGDKYEQEADKMADKVMRMPAPSETRKIQRQPEEKIQKKEDDKIQKAPANEDKLQRFSNQTPPDVSAKSQSSIQSKKASGQPLPEEVRGFMEPRFGADFSKVRVHHDAEAGALSNQLSARAFTHENHVFFSNGQYQPGTSEGRQLLAHELTHTVQQGHAIQRSPQITTTTTPPPIQRLGVQNILDKFAEWANHIPGFRMLTIVMGINPINMRSVDRNAANILRAMIEIMPGGHLITQALDNHGVFAKAGAWIDRQLAMLGNSGGDLVAAIKRFVNDLKLSDAWDLGGVWERAKLLFTSPIAKLTSFAISAAVGILKLIKDAVLLPLAKLAEGTKGYDLLKAILGQDPVTGDAVPRTADTLIGGFMKLIGQEEVWENIKKGKAIQRAWAWFQGALSGLMGFVQAIPKKVVTTITSLTIQDVLTVTGAFVKVAGAFANIATAFFSWAFKQVLSLLEILFSVVAPGVMPYIKKAQAAFSTIIKNPIGFVNNLVRAGKRGFELFAGNILTHLKTALIKWITGPLGEAGVYIPTSFSLMEMIKLVLSVLGLTWQNIRSKLVKIIPEPVLVALEKTAGILVTLVKDGPAAAWEQIKTELTELKDQLIGQVTAMISGEVVKAAVTKLVSMLNPAGAVIQAIIAIYNTVTFFIQKINQIAAVVASFIDSIAAIAAGQVENAAKKVELTMANTLAVIIAFLAKFVGLGNVPNKLVAIVKKIRKPIDAGLDKIVTWLGNLLKKVKTAVSSWWKQKKPFTNKSGENHTLSFSGSSEDNATLQISTTTMPLTKYLADKRVEHKDSPNILAKVILAEGLLKQKEVELKAGNKTEDEKAKNAKVVVSMTEISQALMDLGGGALKDEEYENSVPEPGGTPPISSGYALLSKPKMPTGQLTSGDHGTHGWGYIKKEGLTSLAGDKWVQMHLVSEKLGGKAIPGNLVPAPNSVNSAWRSGIEAIASSLVNTISTGGAKNVVWISSAVSYYADSPKAAGGAKFANSVQTKVGLHAYKGKVDKKPKFEKVSSPVFTMSAQIPTPDFSAAKKVSLNSSGGSHLRDLGGVDAAIVNEIKRNRPYTDIAHFKKKMIDALDIQYANKDSDKYRSLKKAIESVKESDKLVVKDNSAV